MFFSIHFPPVPNFHEADVVLYLLYSNFTAAPVPYTPQPPVIIVQGLSLL